ncbi:hypothetical protein VWN77_11010, partial [Campylobacter coli]
SAANAASGVGGAGGVTAPAKKSEEEILKEEEHKINDILKVEIYINTTALGEIIAKKESKNIKAGLSILLSGDIGRHGASVLI